MRSREEVECALALLATGATATEVGRALAIPRSTVRDWRHGRFPGARGGRQPSASTCGFDVHARDLDGSAYCYLLGLYLGDGYIARVGRTRSLRITLDARYPGIVEECASAMAMVAQQHPVGKRRRKDAGCVDVSAYWNHWPCLFPQHGPGYKHTRHIELTVAQWSLVERNPEAFLRGLIHSDGCRSVAVERKGNNVRHAARYSFKNRSEDILSIFGTACDLVDVYYTRSSATTISIYRKEAVARLDGFIGPKR